MSYPAISLSTATVGRHRCPQKRLQTARQPPVYPNSSPDHRACNSLTPFRCPHAVHSCPSVDSGLRVTDLNQLSGGYRIILAVAADLARWMAQGNPHLDDPLLSEATVLLDEIELHLHPAWQQLVLEDLIRTFPNVQFIVATHSPQVLTTVKPEHIVELRYYADGIRASRATGPTFGAEAGYVLDTVMGVTERPPGNEFVTDLEQYRQLVNDGLGESELALDIRRKLENLSPRDPALDRADIEIRRNRVLNDIGQ